MKSAAVPFQSIKQQQPVAASTNASSAESNNAANSNNNYSGIDEVLSESDQLLRAAAEAQALGRLRSANTYLLLAHARLVGLGRRFDRSRIIRTGTGTTNVAAATADVSSNDNKNNGNNDDGANQSNTTTAGGKGGKHSNSAIDPLIQSESNMSLPNATTNNKDQNKNTADNNNEPMLPSGQSMHHMPDGFAYVEHIARTAMELHHKRTGRGMQHDTMVERQHAAIKARQVEQEQIRLAARGLFATAKGFTGVSVGAPNENSRDAPPTTRKRKATEAHLDSEERNALAKRKGGRGKKPPTLVQKTVMGRNEDVHELMKGSLMH